MNVASLKFSSSLNSILSYFHIVSFNSDLLLNITHLHRTFKKCDFSQVIKEHVYHKIEVECLLN